MTRHSRFATRIVLAASALLLLPAFGSAARADESAIPALLIPPTFVGPVTDQEKAVIIAGIESSVSGYAFDDGFRDDVIRGDPAGRLATCIQEKNPDCKMELARRTSAKLVLDVAVTKQPGAEVPPPPRHERRKHHGGRHDEQPQKAPDKWSMYVAVYDPSVGTLGAKDSATYEGPEFVSDLKSLVTKVVADERARARGTVRITSTPTGASILLDEHPVGSTPVVLKTYADNSHTLVVQCDEGAPQRKTFDAQIDETVSFEFKCPQKNAAGAANPGIVGGKTTPASASSHHAASRTAFKVLGPVLLVAGAGVVGLGGYYLALDGGGTGCGAAGHACSGTYDTVAQGAGAVAGGAVMMAAGATLTYFGFRKLHPHGSASALLYPVVSRDLVGLAAGGSF